MGRALPAYIPAEAKSPDPFWGQSTRLFNGPREIFPRELGGRGLRLIDSFPSCFKPENDSSYTSYFPVRLSGAIGQTWPLALPVQAFATNFQTNCSEYPTSLLVLFFFRLAGKFIVHILTLPDPAYYSPLLHSTRCHTISSVDILSLSNK
jgi:hypothetical protein